MADGQEVKWKDSPPPDGWRDSGPPPQVAEFTGESNLSRIPLDVAAGAGKGALSTLSGISSALGAVPGVGKYLAPPSGVRAMKAVAEPTNIAQKLGYGAEQGAEFLAPGAGEERIGELAADIPKVGRIAGPLARIATGALDTGALQALHGGSFKQGAEIGGGAGTAGELARMAAPGIAESALGIGRRQRGFGRTPGEAVLQEIRGFRPETISENAQTRIGDLLGELESKANASNTPVSLQDAIDAVDREQIKALRQNNKSYYDQLHTIREQLTRDLFTGQPIPRMVPPSQALDLKRGIGSLERSWNPDQRGLARGTVRKVYGAMDRNLDTAVPGSAEINQKVSSLIPVEQRAESESRGSGLGQRMAGRLAAHTGALTGAVGGGLYGYRERGVPGAVVGTALGLAAPEILASPTVQMMGARAAYSGIPGRVARGIVAPLLQRAPKDEGDEAEEQQR